jgi:hypothetical protein
MPDTGRLYIQSIRNKDLLWYARLEEGSVVDLNVYTHRLKLNGEQITDVYVPQKDYVFYFVPRASGSFAKTVAAATAAAAPTTRPVLSLNRMVGPCTVPFKFMPGLADSIVIPVWINKQGPLDMVLDTGATSTVFDLAGFTGEVRGREAWATVPGGGRVRSIVVTADDVAVPCVGFGPMEVQFANLNFAGGIHGLLGHSFLKNFLVEINYKKGTVTLTPN